MSAQHEPENRTIALNLVLSPATGQVTVKLGPVAVEDLTKVGYLLTDPDFVAHLTFQLEQAKIAYQAMHN